MGRVHGYPVRGSGADVASPRGRSTEVTHIAPLSCEHIFIHSLTVTTLPLSEDTGFVVPSLGPGARHSWF